MLQNYWLVTIRLKNKTKVFFSEDVLKSTEKSINIFVSLTKRLPLQSSLSRMRLCGCPLAFFPNQISAATISPRNKVGKGAEMG